MSRVAPSPRRSDRAHSPRPSVTNDLFISGMRLGWRRLRWAAERHLGWPAGLGLCGLLVAALLALQVRPDIESARRDLLRRQVAQLSQVGSRPLPAPSVGGGAEVATDDQLDARDRWLRAAPAAAQRTATIARLLTTLEGQGLQLGSVEYRLEAQATGLMRLVVRQEAEGSYLQLRRGIARVLAQLPYGSLDGLEIERPVAERSGLQARLQWSLYFREGR